MGDFQEISLATQTEPVSTTSPAQVEEPYPGGGYAWYVVGVLTLVYIFSFIDRQILSLLVEPIRRDLGISDTQMSWLMGISFALFYTFFGILIGRLADSRSRRTIIAIGFALWSLMTAGCGLAKDFAHMLLLRMGVGVGEAALSPAAYSLITDYFPKERLSTAISVYSMGIYIGAGLAYLLGGVVVGVASAQEIWNVPLAGAIRPWQVIFFMVGLPGVALALLMYTVKEPVRRGRRLMKARSGRARVEQTPLREVFNYILENKRVFLCHNIGFALIALGTNAGGAWNPTYFVRNHGWTASRAGIVLGFALATCGTLGIVAGGRFADWLTARGCRDSNMRVGLMASLMMIPASVLFYLMPDGRWAIAMYVPLMFLSSAPFGVAPAAIQQMMPNSMRGQASAIYIFAVNLIGLGIGPTAAALITDYVFRNDYHVNYSLLAVSVSSQLAAASLLWLGLKPFRQSLDYLKEWTAANV